MSLSDTDIASLSTAELRALSRFSRSVERQSKFDADVAKALVRILRGDERGIARGVGSELRKLIGEITNA
jgi:hypothetical protein